MIELSLKDLTEVLNASLIGRDLTFTGCSIDSRTTAPGNLFIALQGQRFDGHEFVEIARQRGAVAAVVERPVATDFPMLQVADTRHALSMLAHFWRQRFKLPIVAVTGSNGKTSTKEMLRTIFALQGPVLANHGNFNNEIGVPLTLFELNAQHQFAVIEMGANHSGEIASLSHLTQPTVAVITQCAPAHLEGFKDVMGVAKAKGEIFTGLLAKGTAVINRDDEFAAVWDQELSNLSQTLALNLCNFGIDCQSPLDVWAQAVQLTAEHSQFELNTPVGTLPVTLPLLGRHNVMNALAAAACALACQIPLPTIQQGLQDMRPVKGRLQPYPGLHQTYLIDDTYNANPGSLQAALKVLGSIPTPRYLVLGDMNELGPHSDHFHKLAGQQARAQGITQLWAMGTKTYPAVESFGEGAYHFENHEELLSHLQAALVAGTTILVKGSRGMRMEKIVAALRVDNHL